MKVEITISELPQPNTPRKDTLRKYYRNSALSDDELLEITKWLAKYLHQTFVVPGNHTLKCLIEYEEHRRNELMPTDTDYRCCEKMKSELTEEHIIHLNDGRWFLQCMNPISYCPFCGILLPTSPVKKDFEQIKTTT